MIPRLLAKSAQKAFSQYPIVTLTGPRQSGKTTLAKALFDLPYINLEDPVSREFATQDPKDFLAQYKNGAIIDEIQRVTDLTSYIQVMVDESNRAGQYILTSSIDFAAREQVSQSLAGRTALLTLLPLSQQEITYAGIEKANHFESIVTGGYPRIFDRGINESDFCSDYIGTYLDRDLRLLSGLRDLSRFQLFMRLCAAQTGQLLNLNRLGNDCGISQSTATEWLNLLEASYVLYRLKPYFANTTKRLVKRPKLYFYDTGIACYLLGISEPEHLEYHPLRGAIFENWVINEVLKYDLGRQRTSDISFYADSNGNEVDLIYRSEMKLVPIEIKSGQTVHQDFFKGVMRFSKSFSSLPGAVVYAGSSAQERSSGHAVIPVDDLTQFLQRISEEDEGLDLAHW